MKKEIYFLGKTYEELTKKGFEELYTQHQYDRVYKTVFWDGNRIAKILYDNNDKIKRFIIVWTFFISLFVKTINKNGREKPKLVS